MDADSGGVQDHIGHGRRVWRRSHCGRRGARGPDRALLHLCANSEGRHAVQPLSRHARRPVTPTTSKIVYTLFFDNSMLPDDAARAADKERRRTRFMQALQNMKTVAEGGKLPPAPPAAAPAAPR